MSSMQQFVYQPSTGPWLEYQWLVIFGGVVSFAAAWAIGANDVANAFGTAVGAKTLTLWQACLIASIFEFSGAVSLGEQVTKTVSGSITSPAYFANVPEVFAFGMLSALVAAWLWVTLATYLELAVSTTHSIIGAILGFGLVYGGKNAIIWSASSDSFPYVEGVVPIVISWFSSPIAAGVFAALFFLINRKLILRRERSHVYAFYALPVLVFVTIFVNTFFVLYKGAADLYDWPTWKCAAIGAAVAGVCTGIAVPVTAVLMRRHAQQLERSQSALDSLPEIAKVSSDWNQSKTPDTLFSRLREWLCYPVTVDVHEEVYRDDRVATMHSAAEVFDPRSEEIFKYLQVFSSCCVSFAHGANDVSNAVGPFSAIWYVYNNMAVPLSEVTAPRWILALGGAGIVTGLATYGYNIIKVLGVKMCKMTPSRGYCAELSVAFTVSVASVWGMPVSTTHCIVGAEAGVGMVEGVKTGTNWRLLAKTACAWVTTLAIAGSLSAALFAFGVYSPHPASLQVIADYEALLHDAIQFQVAQLNATNYGNLETLGRFNDTLNNTLNLIQRDLDSVLLQEVVNNTFLLQLAASTSTLYESQIIPVVGFNRSGAFNTSANVVVPA